MAKRKTTHKLPANFAVESEPANIDSPSTEVMELLNNKWLPDEAVTSCLSLLHCVNGIITHWKSLTHVEPNSFFPSAHDVCGESEPNPIRECLFAINKYKWLRDRLPEILKQLHQPEELVAFLTEIRVLDGSTLARTSTNQLTQHTEYLDSRIVSGLEELTYPLTNAGRIKDLPEGWQITGWNNYLMGIQPVRDIPELISHLKRRAKYIRFMGSSARSLLAEELLNARLAIQEMIPDPERRPRYDYDTNDFSQSQLQLDQMIHDLSLMEAQDAKAAGQQTAGEKSSDYDVSIPKKGPSRDERRLMFYEASKANNPRLKQSDIARMWCEVDQDYCDAGAFKQSLYRARENRKK